jgi:quinol monooxygenase YgiN
MSKVIFTVQYELDSTKVEEFHSVINELKNLLRAEGLEDYSVYEVKGKPNHYQEQYTFVSEEAFDAFDDNTDERINILVSKLNDLTVDHSAKYVTLNKIL